MSSDTPSTPDSIPVVASTDKPIDDLLPEDLPPVEPPSAGFIVQLFVVPALIVVAVIGVWAMFGKLAASEQDYRSLTRELGSSNEHRRWRAALGLAQMLKTDLDQGEDGQGLNRNREIATDLSTMLDERLGALLPTDEGKREKVLKHQEFLARTLGLMDVPDVVLPVLQKAMDEQYDSQVRKNSIASLALIAGRSEAAGKPMDSVEIVDSLVTATNDEDVLIRQMGTYGLGLMKSDTATDRLKALLSNADQNTRYNAAIGLVRRDSSAGISVFKEVLTNAAKPADKTAISNMNEEQLGDYTQRKQFLEPVMLMNTLKALGDLRDQLSEEELKTLVLLVRPISESYPNAEIRVKAEGALQELTR